MNRDANRGQIMSNPATILDQCRRLGLRVSAEGDPTGIAPKGSVPVDLRELTSAAKPFLLPILRDGAGLRSDCVPWLHIGQQILAGKFDGANRGTVGSLTIGLRNIPHPLCRRALERLPVRS